MNFRGGKTPAKGKSLTRVLNSYFLLSDPVAFFLCGFPSELVFG
jgi:hypothetical protein